MIGQLLEVALGVGLEVARERSLKKDFIPSAVEIARYQGWVSPHRMSSQLGLGLRDAQIVILAACSRGLLYQAMNGRYYVSPSPLVDLRPIAIGEEPARFKGIASLPAVAEAMPARAEQRSGNGRRVLVTVSLVMSFGVGTALIVNGGRTASQSVAPLLTATPASPSMVPRAAEIDAIRAVQVLVGTPRPVLLPPHPAPIKHQKHIDRHRH